MSPLAEEIANALAHLGLLAAVAEFYWETLQTKSQFLNDSESRLISQNARQQQSNLSPTAPLIRFAQALCQKLSFIPNWICRAPVVRSGRFISEVDWPKVPGLKVRFPGWPNWTRLNKL